MYLTLSGGGMGGIAFVGAYKALLECRYNFTGYIGTSAGAIFALFFSIGLGYENLSRLCERFHYSDIEDLHLLGLLENFGIDNGSGIEKLIRGVIAMQIGSPNATFKDHYQITGKILKITTFCVEDDLTILLDHVTAPNMPLYKAVMMSIAIPWVIAAVKWQGKTYIDGGFHNPFPIQETSPHNTIGIRLNNKKINGTNSHPFIGFTINLVSSLLCRSHMIARRDTYGYNIIDINTGISMFDISISKSERKDLIQKGYTDVMNHHAKRPIIT